MSIFFDYIDKVRKSEFYRNILILISGNGVSQIIPLIVYPILSRLYSPDEFGILALLFSIHGLFIIIATGQIEYSVILPKEKKDAKDLFNSGIYITFIACVILFILLLIFGKAVCRFFNYQAIDKWILFLPLTIFTTAIPVFINSWNTRIKRFRLAVEYAVILSLITVVLKLSFGLLKIESGLIIAFISAQFISGLFYFVRSYKYLENSKIVDFFNRPNWDILRVYKNFPKFVMPQSLLNSISGNLPFFLMTTYFSAYYAGLFSVAYTLLFKPATLYSNSVYQVLYQKTMDLKNKQLPASRIIHKFLFRTAIIFLIPGIILFFIAPFLFSYFLGDEWKEAGQFCSLMIPWAYLVLLSGSLSFIPNAYNKQAKSLIINLIYFILRLVGLLTGIYFENIFLTIGLYTMAGIIINTYQLVWYRYIVVNSDFLLLKKS